MNERDIEQRLRQTQAMMDAVPGLVFLFRPDGVFVDCRGRDTADLFAPAESFIGKHFSEVLPPHAAEKLSSALEEALATQQTVTADYDLALPQGQTYFEARVSPSGDGQVVCLVQNVSERFRTAKRLEETSGLLTAIAAAQGAYIGGRDPRHIFTDLLSHILRLSSSEHGFIGEVHYDDDGAPFLRTFAITNVAWNDEVQRFYDEHATTGLEFRNLNTLFGAVMTSCAVVISNDPPNDPRRGGLPPGHPPLQSFLGLPLLRGRLMVGMIGLGNRPGGYDEAFVQQIAPFVATCANIVGAVRADVERELYQSALAKSEAHVRAVVDSVSDGIVTFDERGVIQRVNPAMLRIFGGATEDVVERRLSLFMSATDGTMFEADLRRHVGRVRSSLLDKPYEFVGIGRDDKNVPIELTVSELGPAYPNSFVGILRDVTERKRIERMQAEFVSMVSHELRTPLTSIRGALGLLEGGVFGNLPNEMHELISMAVSNSERLTRLVDDIIDIERIAAGQLSVRLERVEMGAAIRSAVEASRRYIEQHGVEIVIENESPAYVRSDSHRIAQVLANLISNAVKFSPETGRIVITTIVKNGWVRVAVRDHGPGVPEQFRSRLFQRFAQADGSDKRLRGGTGLGLSIAKSVIEQLGGRIGYENADGGGAQFFFELEAIAEKA